MIIIIVILFGQWWPSFIQRFIELQLVFVNIDFTCKELQWKTITNNNKQNSIPIEWIIKKKKKMIHNHDCNRLK